MVLLVVGLLVETLWTMLVGGEVGVVVRKTRTRVSDVRRWCLRDLSGDEFWLQTDGDRYDTRHDGLDGRQEDCVWFKVRQPQM